MATAPRSPVPPLRWWRPDPEGTAQDAWADGATEDGRTDVRAPGAATERAPGDGTPDPPVLALGAVLVAFDGGPAGRAALEHAVRTLPGTLAVVHLWEAVDPLRAARIGGHHGAGAALVHEVHADNERARADGEAIAAGGVALAQEAGRSAVPVVLRQTDAVSHAGQLRELAERNGAAHLVLAAAPRRGWRRVLHGPSAPELLAADPPCPCTVVPTPGR